VRRRILVAIFAVAALTITLFAVPLAIVVERLVDQDALLRVERTAILAAAVAPENFSANHDSVALPSNTVGIDLALYNPRGMLVGAVAIVVVAAGGATGYVIAGRLARPVRALRDAAVQLGDGDFSLRVPRSTIPEIDQAAVAMIATAARLDAWSRESGRSALTSPISSGLHWLGYAQRGRPVQALSRGVSVDLGQHLTDDLRRRVRR